LAERPRALLTLPRRALRSRAVSAAAHVPTIVTLGDLLLDVVVRPSRPPERATDVPGSIEFRVGGAAANTARCVARLGGRSALICAIGRDGWGRRLLEAVAAEGVVVRAVSARAATGRLVAIVDPGGERSFITQRGAADDIAAADIRPAWLRGAGALHVSAYVLFSEPGGGGADRAAELAHLAGAMVSVDLSSHGPMRSLGREAVWARVAAIAPEVIFGNREEAATLSGGRGWRRAEALLELAPIVVVKMGAEGCRVLWRDAGAVARLDVATSPMLVADTTGAGDAFAAGFLLALLREGPSHANGPSDKGPSRAVSGADACGTAPGTARGPVELRRAAMAGHRAAADVLRRPRVRLDL